VYARPLRRPAATGERLASDPRTQATQPRKPRSSLPIIGRRLAASSSFVLACALAGAALQALQPDPARATARTGSDEERGNSSPQPGGQEKQVTGSI
jgi:hypothetical protein